VPRGARLRVRITATDLLTLDVHASVVARLDDPATTADDAVVDDAEIEEASDELAGGAGPLTLAIDMPGDEAAHELASVPAASPV
jgi:exoribonuclease-2